MPHRILLLLTFTAICFVECHEDPVFNPTWTYKCIPDEGCQRAEAPAASAPTESNVTTSPIFASLDLCRTVCGRFGGLWPRPVTAALSTHTVKIHPQNLRYDLIDVPAEVRSLLAKMSKLATRNMLAECGGNVTEPVERPVVVYLTVKSPSLELSWETNEQYMLDIQTKANDIAVHIVAETVYGARHALESLTQLTSSGRSDFTDETECSLHLVSGAKIKDKPVYKHRGFLLDTSRNFIPMSDIKRMLDGMAATKMNVFHWHVTDTHSFPLESGRVPQLTRYGAYSATEIYSEEEIIELIEYARVRGIRVLIEIDSPAHAGNGWQWGREYGFGDLAVCVNAEKWRQYCIQPPCGQLNPANPSMYNILRNLYRDIAEMLPKPALLHMGGDEVFIPCWNSSQEIVSYMKSQNFDLNQEGFMQLWGEFHQKALKIWDEEYEASGGNGPQPVILWSSELTQISRVSNYLDKDRYVIEVWEPMASRLLHQLIQYGYRVLSVPKDVWYLDHGFWGTTTFSNWRRMYVYNLPTDQNVLGGEVAMWSEYVDRSDLDGRVWPRAAAVAERLWANPSSLANTAEPRLQRLRKRLISRGLRPDVLSPMWCAQNDGKCL